MNFKEWLKGYKLESDNALKEWQKESGLKNIIPKGFEETLLQQYNAYRNARETRCLVIATWVLAIATIILSILTLILN